MDEALKIFLDDMKRDLREHVTAACQGVEDRTAALIAAEVGSVHNEVRELDRRLRRVDGNTITTMELLTRQSRWHEESDSAVRDISSSQSDLVRGLEELRYRVAKLERGQDAAWGPESTAIDLVQ